MVYALRDLPGGRLAGALREEPHQGVLPPRQEGQALGCRERAGADTPCVTRGIRRLVPTRRKTRDTSSNHVPETAIMGSPDPCRSRNSDGVCGASRPSIPPTSWSSSKDDAAAASSRAALISRARTRGGPGHPDCWNASLLGGWEAETRWVQGQVDMVFLFRLEHARAAPCPLRTRPPRWWTTSRAPSGANRGKKLALRSLFSGA